MDSAGHSSMAAAFDRSNGLLPMKEIGDLAAAATALGRALIVSCDQYVRNVQDNAPETEREIVRLHLSFLNTCTDVVRGRLREIERAPKAPPAAAPPAPSSGPERIIIE